MMKSVLIWLFAAAPVLAHEPIASLSSDWNGDGHADVVLLYRTDDGMADLVLLMGDGWRGLQPALTLPGVIFAGPMAGQAPALESRNATSFALLSEQTGVGRTPWSQSLTVIWRDGGFVVAGYDYSFYDRLDLSHYGDCSVNLLTSQFTLYHGPGDEAPEVHREGTTEAVAFPLAELPTGWMAPPCGTLFD
mgnify:CR=1 FL=1